MEYFSEKGSHARLRANQRFDVHLKDSDMQRIIDKIVQGKSEVVRRIISPRTIHKVAYSGTIYYVVFTEKNKRIATFLTEDMIKEYYPFEDNGSDKLCKYCREQHKCQYRKDHCPEFVPSAFLKKIEMMDVILTLNKKLNYYIKNN